MLLIYSQNMYTFSRHCGFESVNAREMFYDGLDLEAEFKKLLPHKPLLVLEGGEDVNPKLYNEANLYSHFSRSRDAEEAQMYAAALVNDIPILGICRGHQLLNVLMGGTLYQDIGFQHPGGPHRGSHIIDYTDLALENGFATMQESFVYGPGIVNSYHHQGIKDLAPGGQVLATHKGLIEAVVYPRALSVQWHPEFEHHFDILHYIERMFYAAGN